jgi:hypothetical protein
MAPHSLSPTRVHIKSPSTTHYDVIAPVMTCDVQEPAWLDERDAKALHAKRFRWTV